MIGERGRGLVRAGCLIVLLLAIAPNVLYVGHWPGLPGEAHMHSPEEAQAHAAHCHGPDAEGCASSPMGPAIPIVEVAGLGLLGGTLWVLLRRPSLPAPSPLIALPDKPPR
jgi:hypothetical protein